ncbi:MAG: hypothetical protein K2G52_12780 [Muribaculaceae bacterium]|nr:hypothetical protein [Muribaculaceae bacterium]
MGNKEFTKVNIIVESNEEIREAAFAKGINRDVNLANAKKIFADMKTNGYRQAELIQVIYAEEVLAKGDITLININGKEITSDDASYYYLILDGQHRVFAASLFNGQENLTPIQVPAVLVELNEDETISQYISAINVTKAEWKPLDYVRGAANVTEHELLVRYKELIKCDENPNGFSLSTLNIIFCGNSKALKKSDLSLLCQGKNSKGAKVNKPIIPAYNLERGNSFITICQEKGFSMKDIAKRYLAEQFEALRTNENSTHAFSVFKSITENDRLAMYNGKGNLDENNVISQFKKLSDRVPVVAEK